MRSALTLFVLAGAAISPGCAFTEPYDRPGTWRPTGAAESNLVAQLARPSDYVAGVPYAPVSTAPLSAAVARWRTDRVRRLPQSSISRVGQSDNSGSDAAPAPTTGTGQASGGAS